MMAVLAILAGFPALDDRVSCARHLGGNGSERLSLEIGVIAIAGDVAFIFGSKTIKEGHGIR